MPVLLAEGELPSCLSGNRIGGAECRRISQAAHRAPHRGCVGRYSIGECADAVKQEAAGDLEHGADQLLPVRSVLGSCQFEEVEGRLVRNPPMSRVQHHRTMSICQADCHVFETGPESQAAAQNRRETRRLFRHLALDTLDSCSL